MDPKMQLVAMILSYTGVGIGLIIGLGALGACVGVGIMCSRFLEGAARQPELMPQLQAKVFLLLGPDRRVVHHRRRARAVGSPSRTRSSASSNRAVAVIRTAERQP